MTLPAVPPTSRRAVLTGAAALAAVGYAAGPAAAGTTKGGIPWARLTVLGTTDLHGNVFNWDYFKNAEFTNAAADDIGVAKVATLIEALKRRHQGEAVLTLDAGDTIQGTPLAYYYARIAPITAGGTHPMAAAMNLVGYDAAALGNHEFNYGIEHLRTFESQLNFPLLGANAVDPATRRPVFPPYVIKEFTLPNGIKAKVGVLGLTNPGIAIWDKANVEGRMEFPGLVEQAKVFVPKLKALGCDVVIVSAHSGADTSSSYGDALPYPENAASLVAEQVPGVDAILVGHAHREIPQRYVRNATTGQDVLLVEPLYWGMRVAVMDLRLELRGRRWRVASATGQTLNSNTVAEHPAVAAEVRGQHDTVVRYVNSVIGTSAQALSAARAVVEDVPIIDFVNYVQADAVKAVLAGADAALPVLSIAAPFSRTAVFPKGDVKIKDVAGLYIYDNTLEAVVLTGAEVKAYLEYSAKFFVTLAPDAPVNPATISDPSIPDYNYDVLSGVDYDIDISKPIGSRITRLQINGADVDPAAQFVVAVNNYRRSGGGNFPGIVKTQVYNEQKEIRQLLIDWAQAKGAIDPADFFVKNWQLVRAGVPITF
jgi:2',3'-cyclic-nucleotide 2'-phosphodiesterase / 3'-nucleotidase